MAIEFHCPYCTAVMRVADDFAGRQGRCPKCETVLMVPDVRPAERRAPDASEVSESPTQSRVDSVADGGMPAVEPDVPQIVPAGSPTIARSLKRRRRTPRGWQRVWLFGVPVICFLLLLSAISWYVVTRLPELSGELPASVLTQEELPPETIPWSLASDVTAAEQDTLREELEVRPEAFLSSRMACRLTAAEDGLSVTLKTTDQTDWYVVDPGSHAALVLWRRKKSDELSRLRNQLLRTAFNSYCRQKLRVINGELPVLDAARFRDELGLTANCDGFGCVVQAVVQNRVVRCAAVDDRGRLYFCLPRGIAAFTLEGATLADGSRPFNGRFDVRVGGQLTLPANESMTEDEAEGLSSDASDDASLSAPAADSEDTEPPPADTPPADMSPGGAFAPEMPAPRGDESPSPAAMSDGNEATETTRPTITRPRR